MSCFSCTRWHKPFYDRNARIAYDKKAFFSFYQMFNFGLQRTSTIWRNYSAFILIPCVALLHIYLHSWQHCLNWIILCFVEISCVLNSKSQMAFPFQRNYVHKVRDSQFGHACLTYETENSCFFPTDTIKIFLTINILLVDSKKQFKDPSTDKNFSKYFSKKISGDKQKELCAMPNGVSWFLSNFEKSGKANTLSKKSK